MVKVTGITNHSCWKP